MSFKKDEMLIMPAVDIKNGKCVQLVQGQPGSEMITIENPENVAKHWEDLGAKNLHIIDLDGTIDGKTSLDVIKKILNEVNVPIQLGGGIRSVDYAKKNGVNITKTLLKSMATSFCEHLEKNGFYAGIYTNEDYIKNKYPSEIFDRFDLWYARYNTEPNRDVNLWQKSSTGKISGINGNVDLDVAYIDFPSLMKEKHLNGW